MLLIKNGTIVNEGKTFTAHLIIKDKHIVDIIEVKADVEENNFSRVIDAKGKYVVPGAIDDQVHFREPGLTHKADIASESRAAVAGGITSFMEMPNTNPQTINLHELENKFLIASESSPANFSFYIGATNNNYSELIKADPNHVCGIKIFMGSSTGNMLVDNKESLGKIFGIKDFIITTHCEDEQIIKMNTALAKEKFGLNVPINQHPVIRNHEACYKSSSLAVSLAKQKGARLHVLHLSTAEEIKLFESDLPLHQRYITAEACIHHLWFTDADYETKGAFIKWNPAVKSIIDRDTLREAVNNDTIAVVATDHAPHTIEEKNHSYFGAPSGGPLVQHAMMAMWDMVDKGVFSKEKAVEKLSHAPAVLFQVKQRGFLRKGYFADIVVIDPNKKHEVTKENILYKCKWSPFEDHAFNNSIDTTIVNGKIAYENGKVSEKYKGMALEFSRR